MGSLTLTAVTAWAGLLIVLAPVYIVWLVVGGNAFAFEEAKLPQALASIGYIGLGPTLIGNFCYLFGVAAVGPQRAAAFLYLSPMFTVLFSTTWLGEALHLYHLVGFSLIVAGLIIVNLDGTASSAKAAADRAAAGR